MKTKILQTNKKFDMLLFYATISLSLIGIIMVLSSSSYLGSLSYDDSYYFFKRQSIFLVLGIIAMLIVSRINYKLYNNETIITLFGMGTVFLLILIYTPLGVTVNSATRWLSLGPFPRFAPSEIAKIFIVFFYAWWITKNYEYFRTLKGYVVSFIPLGIIFWLIYNQPDLSTAGIIVITTVILYFQVGARMTYFFSTGFIAVFLAIYAIITSEYRLKRLTAFLKPFENQLDEGYQVVKSLYALGSGGFFGLGIGNSRQKFLHLPERHTDFIFSIMGEELGFIGLMFVIFLFFVIFWRGYYIALRADTNFGRIVALGITNMLMVQTLMNIAVAAGAFPTTGITLPLISYGGTSLFITLISIGILLNISCNTTSPSRNMVREIRR